MNSSPKDLFGVIVLSAFPLPWCFKFVCYKRSLYIAAKGICCSEEETVIEGLWEQQE